MSESKLEQRMSKADLLEAIGRKLTKASTLSAAHGRLHVGVEAPGIFRSTDGGEIPVL